MSRYILFLSLLLSFAVIGCGAGREAPQPGSSQTPVAAHCTAYQGLPDSRCTPGAIFPNATPAQICVPGYTRTVRNVPYSEKLAVYAEYGIAHHSTGQYEVDHLVPLELGGSNDLTNLWPEAAQPTPGFHEKDQVENYLHAQVCSGQMSLSDAQHAIVTNWKQFLNSSASYKIAAPEGNA